MFELRIASLEALSNDKFIPAVDGILLSTEEANEDK